MHHSSGPPPSPPGEPSVSHRELCRKTLALRTVNVSATKTSTIANDGGEVPLYFRRSEDVPSRGGTASPSSMGANVSIGGGNDSFLDGSCLSDMSTELTIVEERMSLMDTAGAIEAKTQNFEQNVTSTGYPTMSSAAALGVRSSPKRARTTVPQANIDLSETRRDMHAVDEAAAAPVILVVNVQIDAKRKAMIPIRENDSCSTLALQVIKDYQLSREQVWGPLTEYLQQMLEQHLKKDTPESQAANTAATQLEDGDDEDRIGERPKVGDPRLRKMQLGEQHGSPSNAKDGLTTARSQQKSQRPATAGAATGKSRSTIRDRSPATVDRTKPKEEVRQLPSVPKHKPVAARYLLPKREQSPEKESHTFQPVISAKSRAMSTSRGAKAKQPPSANPKPSPESSQPKRAVSSHGVKGLKWQNANRAPDANPGDRLHRQASLMQQKRIAAVEEQQKRDDAKEMEGASFKPKLTKYKQGSSRAHDPYAGLTPRNPNDDDDTVRMSSEELAMRECTFQPVINRQQPSATSRPPSAIVHMRPPSQSVTRELQFSGSSPMESLSPTNASPPEVPSSEPSPKAQVPSIVARLMEREREKNERLEEMRNHRNNYDADGNRLFKPKTYSHR